MENFWEKVESRVSQSTFNSPFKFFSIRYSRSPRRRVYWKISRKYLARDKTRWNGAEIKGAWYFWGKKKKKEKISHVDNDDGTNSI